MDEQKQTSDEQRQTHELAERVADRVTGETVSKQTTELLRKLLESIKGNVLEATLQSLLLYRGQVSQKRDREWARTMAALWTKNLNDENLPTNPHEMQALILGWQGARESTIKKAEYQAGYEAGWRKSYVEGTRFGFGASEIGKDIDSTIRAAEGKKPAL